MVLGKGSPPPPPVSDYQPACLVVDLETPRESRARGPASSTERGVESDNTETGGGGGGCTECSPRLVGLPLSIGCYPCVSAKVHKHTHACNSL